MLGVPADMALRSVSGQSRRYLVMVSMASTSAIASTEGLKADRVLLDDRKNSRRAESRGLRVAGTIMIPLRSDSRRRLGRLASVEKGMDGPLILRKLLTGHSRRFGNSANESAACSHKGVDVRNAYDDWRLGSPTWIAVHASTMVPTF